MIVPPPRYESLMGRTCAQHPQVPVGPHAQMTQHQAIVSHAQVAKSAYQTSKIQHLFHDFPTYKCSLSLCTKSISCLVELIFVNFIKANGNLLSGGSGPSSSGPPSSSSDPMSNAQIPLPDHQLQVATVNNFQKEKQCCPH